jgi:hypothetical protein
MTGWAILVTGPDTAIGENRRRRIVAIATDDSGPSPSMGRLSSTPWSFPDELPNLPHLELDMIGHFALAKIKETVLAVTYS